MFRKIALAAVVALGGIVGSASVPAPAQAQGVYIGVGGPGYGYGGERRYRSYDRGYDYDRPRRYRSYDDGYSERRSYRGGRNCGVETQRYWNGYKWAKRRVPICYR